MLCFLLAFILPISELNMIDSVSKEYQLSESEKNLLIAIRKHENGRPGLEFGVGGPMNSGHPSHRYQDGKKSFLVQCRWAAGTIKKRYKGNLYDFSKIYCGKDYRNWFKSVYYWKLILEKQ